MSQIDATAVRRYLLGTASDGETSTLEQQYFGDAAAIEEIAAVEDTLIEDYLDGRLEQITRDQFERHYLASPRHRARVDTIRRLNARSRSIATPVRWLPLTAAALLVVAAGVFWFARSSPTSTTSGQSTSQLSPSPAPRVFAFSVPPLGVRSADDRPNLVIPGGTDVVALDLERGDATATVRGARAIVRTVSGDEVWSGAAVVDNLAPGILARAEVPATRLRTDDYTITLFENEAQGRELQTYALRVRAR